MNTMNRAAIIKGRTIRRVLSKYFAQSMSLQTLALSLMLAFCMLAPINVTAQTAIHAGTNGGLSISTDGGATFINTGPGLGSGQVNKIFVVGNVIYAGTAGGLSISTNCGATISAADVTGVTDPDGDALTITVSPTTLVLGANTVTVSADDGNGGTCTARPSTST